MLYNIKNEEKLISWILGFVQTSETNTLTNFEQVVIILDLDLIFNKIENLYENTINILCKKITAY